MRPGRHSPAGRTVPYLEEVTAMINGTDDLFTDAPCRDEDPEIMFPWAEPGTAAYERQVDTARAVCAGCPVQAECLNYVLATEDPRYPYGVWAGTTPELRTGLRRAERDAQPRPPGLMPAVAAAAGEPRLARTDPTPGERQGLLVAHAHNGRVPSSVSGSTTRRLVDDGFAERRDASMSRDKPGIRRGRYTQLTAAGRIIAAQLAAEQSASKDQPRELVSTA